MATFLTGRFVFVNRVSYPIQCVNLHHKRVVVEYPKGELFLIDVALQLVPEVGDLVVHLEDGERTDGIVVALDEKLRTATVDAGHKTQVPMHEVIVANPETLKFLLNFPETKEHASRFLAKPPVQTIKPTNAFPMSLTRQVAELISTPTLSWNIPRASQVKERLRSRVQSNSLPTRNIVLNFIPSAHTIGMQQLIRLSRPGSIDGSSRSVVNGLRLDHFQIHYKLSTPSFNSTATVTTSGNL